MTSESSSWPRLAIGTIAEPRLGGNYRNTESVSSRPLVKMGNIARVSIDLYRVEYIPDTESVNSSHRLRYGDVLFNTRNTLDLVGKVSIWRGELPVAYYNSNILRLEFKSDWCGDSRYFGYALNSAESIKEIRNLATGTTSVAAVYTRDLLKLEVPVPSKSEQCTIADALEDADRLVSSLEGLIVKKQAINQGMMQQLLTGRTRLPGFAATWREVCLRDVGATYGGLTGKTKEDFGTGSAQFVTFMEVMGGPRLRGKSLEPVKVLQGERQNAIQRGDVLFNGSSETPEEVALAAVVDFDPSPTTFLNSFCFGYRLKGNGYIDPAYLAYFFRSEGGRTLVAALAQGAIRYNIAKTKLLDVSPVLPQVDEQRAIVAALADTEDEIATAMRRLDKARAIRTGMMQQLLTGKTRLPVEESAV